MMILTRYHGDGYLVKEIGLIDWGIVWIPRQTRHKRVQFFWKGGVGLQPFMANILHLTHSVLKGRDYAALYMTENNLLR